MIRSMTAFARTSDTSAHGTLTWELRSVNHRYLEVNLRLPENFRAHEKAYREAVLAVVERGKVDLVLKYQPGEASAYALSLNTSLVSQLSDIQVQLASKFPGMTTNMTELLAWPGVLNSEALDLDTLCQESVALLNQALVAFQETREREGQGLTSFFESRLNDMASELKKVEALLPQVQAGVREKLQARFETLSVQVDPERLEQEIVILLQKMDVAEEMQRLHAHIEEVTRIVRSGGVVGRRLDFLMQELNREANTLGSKSSHVDLTQSVVELKVLIEQMREQVQNIE